MVLDIKPQEVKFFDEAFIKINSFNKSFLKTNIGFVSKSNTNTN